MITNFLPYFSVYADPKLRHEVTANDIFDLIDSDNVLNLYITTNDLKSADDTYQQVLQLRGEERVVLFDIAKEIEGRYFRNYDLVESIEIDTSYDTKPTLKNIIKKFEGMYFYQQFFFLYAFDFNRRDWFIPISSKRELNQFDIKNYLARTTDISRNDCKYKIMPLPAIAKKISTALGMGGDAMSESEKEDLNASGIFINGQAAGDFLDSGVDPEEAIYANKIYNRLMIWYAKTAEGKSKIPTEKEHKMPKCDFYEFVLTDKINAVKEWITDEEFNRILVNTILYGDGLFGLSMYAQLGNNRPTIYEVEDILAQDHFEENSSYYLAQVKHFIIKRWSNWMLDKTSSGYLKTSTKTNDVGEETTILYYDFKTATKIIGLGVFDVAQRFKQLQPVLEASGLYGQKTEHSISYHIYTGQNMSGLSSESITTTVTIGDGDVEVKDIITGELRKKKVYKQGQGTENVYFVSLKTFIKKFNISDDFIFASIAGSIGDKSFWLVHNLTSANAGLNNKNFCEFYDREHASPFDGIEFYCPIPLSLMNYDNRGMYFGKYRYSCYPFSTGIQYTIYKRKYNEDENGNITIEDLPDEKYPAGTFKIPINKNEYIYKVFAERPITTWLSRDVVYHIKIKFTKQLNRKQNIVFRLFAGDYTFATHYYVKRG